MHRGIFSLCFVTDPLTGLSDRTKSSWVSETATCSFKILYRKVIRLIRLRSSSGSRRSCCNRAVTLVVWLYLFVIQRAARLWIFSRASQSFVKGGSHTVQAYSKPDLTNAIYARRFSSSGVPFSVDAALLC